MLLSSNGHSFKRSLRAMASLQKSAAVIITRPPEIIACLKVTDTKSGQNAYIIFDSHPRPSHPDGAALIFCSSLDKAANILGGILHVDEGLMSSRHPYWGAQLLTNFLGHIFVAKNGPLVTGKSILKSSLTVLALRSAIKELNQQNDALAFQNGKHDEVATLDDVSNQEKSTSTKAITYTVALSPQEHMQGRRDYSQLNAVAGPSRLPLVPQYNGARGVNPPPLPPRKPSTHEFENNMLKKARIHFIKEDNRESMQNAFKLRNTFDAKDAVLHYRQAELKSHLQKRFDCGICLEKCLEDDAARVDGCGHTMCRGCMKSFITAKIAEHRFPIFCPICIVNNGGRPAAGTHHAFECDQSCNAGTWQKFPVC